MKRMTWGLAVVVSVGLCVLTGCSVRLPVALPGDLLSLEMGADDYRVTGQGAGKDCATTFLILIHPSSPSFGKAEERALSASKGSFLVNKRLYDGVEQNFIIFARHCRYVEGTGISF